MNPISRLTPLQGSSPLKRTVKAPETDGPAIPADTTEIAAKPPTSNTKRLLKWGMAASMGVVATSSLVGGIAYHANKDALMQAPSVNVYPQKLSQPRSATPAEQVKATKAAPKKAPAVKAGPLRVLVPPQTLTQFSQDIQDTAQFKAMTGKHIQFASQELAQQVAVLKVPDSEVLLDVTMPLPTSQRAFLHVGSVDLPSLGMRALQPETVPLALQYTTQPIATGLKVNIQTVDAPSDLKGPGILLGAVQVTLSSETGKIPIQGQLDLKTDLSGEATQKHLDQLRGVPGQETLVQQLEARLAQGQKLQGTVQEQGVTQLLQDGMSQRIAFQANVVTGTGPLAQSTLYLWATPDVTGDGKADIQVTQANSTGGIEKVTVELGELGDLGKAPPGTIASRLHATVQKALRKGLEDNLPKVTGDLQRMARERAEKEFARGGPRLQELANAQLGGIYAKTDQMQVKTGNALAPLLGAHVGNVQVTDQGLLVDLQSHAGGSGQADFTGNLNLKPGQFAAGMDLSVLNGQLKQVDWQSMLDGVKQKAGLLDLQFGKDSRGNAVIPQLSHQGGRLVASFDVVAHLKGAEPIKGVTGVASGATGALDQGMGKVQKTLEKEAGGFGAVLGGILRAPTFVVDKVVGGGKFVVDNTVGRVVDAVPEVATRPTVHTRVSVPLNLSTQNGALTVSIDGKAVEFQKAQSKLPFDILDLLPTRLLSNVIVGAVADAQGPAQVGQQLQKQGLDIDLQQKLGVRFDEVRVGRDGDLTVIMNTSQRTADWVAQQIPQR